jgi:hypothetical protein
MVVLKRIGILSLAKLEAILMAIFGLIMGLFYAIFSSLLNSAEFTTETVIDFGWWGVLIFPIFYGIMGFVTGIVGALFYNLVAKWVGGVKLELTK